MKIHIFFLVIISSFFLAPLSLADKEKEDTAYKVAETWLKIVDDGQYKKSWHSLAELLRQKVTKEEWAIELTNIRLTIGKLKSRTLVGARYVRDLPDAPKGEYVVVQYKSVFTLKASVLETAVPLLDKDGKWRVSGYFIQSDLPE